MADRTAEEAKQVNVDAMGPSLGSLYSALWQSVVTIHSHWNEYVVLFGTSPERIDLLNKAAPSFFRMLQDELWDNSLLHLARLTDPANSHPKKDRTNLTIQALPLLIVDCDLRDGISKLVAEAIARTEFCRDWRNRRIAHSDLKLALEQQTTPLAGASRLQVKAALEAIAKVLNAVNSHYCQSETFFDYKSSDMGALSMLRLLEDGLKVRQQRLVRLKEGH